MTTTSFAYDAPIPYDETQPYNYGSSWGTSGSTPKVLPHLSASMQLGTDGTFLFWQQGTIDEVTQCVEVVCGTTMGARTVVPGFGIPDLTFTTESASQIQRQIQQAVNQWEPRANVAVNVVEGDFGQDTISVSTSLRRGSTT